MARISSDAANGAPDAVSEVEQAPKGLDHLYAWIAGMAVVSAMITAVIFVTFGTFTFPSLGSVARNFVAMNQGSLRVLGLQLA